LTVDPLEILNGILTNPLQKSWVSSCKLIKSASTPIIKLVSTEDFEEIFIDISMDGPNHRGMECIREVLRFKEAYPALKPIMLIIKQLLKVNNLHESY
jgi:DNA polymerase sigma